MVAAMLQMVQGAWVGDDGATIEVNGPLITRNSEAAGVELVVVQDDGPGSIGRTITWGEWKVVIKESTEGTLMWQDDSGDRFGWSRPSGKKRAAPLDDRPLKKARNSGAGKKLAATPKVGTPKARTPKVAKQERKAPVGVPNAKSRMRTRAAAKAEALVEPFEVALGDLQGEWSAEDGARVCVTEDAIERNGRFWQKIDVQDDKEAQVRMTIANTAWRLVAFCKDTRSLTWRHDNGREVGWKRCFQNVAPRSYCDDADVPGEDRAWHVEWTVHGEAYKASFPCQDNGFVHAAKMATDRQSEILAQYEF